MRQVAPLKSTVSLLQASGVVHSDCLGTIPTARLYLKRLRKQLKTAVFFQLLNWTLGFLFPSLISVGNIVQRFPAIVSVVSPLLASEILLDLWFVQKICKVHYTSCLDHPGG